MRQFLSLLKEYRIERLKTHNAPETRLAEVSDMYRWLDGALSGVMLNEGGGMDDPETKLQEVMTSADFTYAIQEFVQRKMFPAYQEKTFNFEPFIKPDTTPNYLPVSRYQKRAGLDDLEYVGEKGEALPGSVVDATKRQYQVYKWEKQFDFSMEALVNDDLGYFNDQATDMGRAARRTLEKYVSRMMWNATTIARLVGLGALYSTTGRLNTARISTARMAFNQRTDARGNPAVAALRYIVYHAGLADTVDQIRQSTYQPDQVGTIQPLATNIWRSGWTPVEDPHVAGTAPNLPWFALASWQESGMIAFVLARRSGMPAPLILRKKSDIESITSLLGAGGAVPPVLGDFATSNVVVKVWDEFGTYIDSTEGNLFDFRGAYYSAGTAA
jgi:hypothetical protein